MLKILEPCCFNKQLDDVLASLKPDEPFTGASWGDVTLPHLLSYFVAQAQGAEILLVLPRLTKPLLAALSQLMGQYKPGGGYLIEQCVLISCGCDRKLSLRYLDSFRPGGRMVICEDKVATRILAISSEHKSFTLTGALQQEPSYGLSTWQLSLSRQVCDDFHSLFRFQKIRRKI